MYTSAPADTLVETAGIDAELVHLMNQHERALYNFLLLLVHEPEVAKDCVQDTFLRAYEQLRKEKPVNAAWLFTVARHRAIDRFRKERRTQSAGDTLEQIPSSHRPERSADVRVILQALPPGDRDVLYLFEVAGFKTDEIGTMLGIRGSAVRQRLYRARERFRAMYGPEP